MGFNKENMIHYFPGSLDNQSDRASSKRPFEIQEFLKERGNKGDVVISGNSKQRLALLYEVLERDDIESLNYIYIESTNMPLFLNEIRGRSFQWYKELKAIGKLKKKGVKIILFYRDMYWRFPEFKKSSFSWKVKVFFHWMEWVLIAKHVDLLLLPTGPIQEYLPENELPKLEFHPGIIEWDEKLLEHKETSEKNQKIKLLYVGGVIPPFYKLFLALDLVKNVKNLELTICCRDYEWARVKHMYSDYDFDRVNIVHKSGEELIPLYLSHNVFLDLREPVDYYKYAFPYKYIESISYNMPLVILKGSSAEDFVTKNNFGWACKDLEEAIQLFSSFDVDSMLDYQREIQKNKHQYSWENRFQYLDAEVKKLSN